MIDRQKVELLTFEVKYGQKFGLLTVKVKNGLKVGLPLAVEVKIHMDM